MSSQDPIGSTAPPERPANPTHFGGEGLYESKPDIAESAVDDSSSTLKVPLGEHVGSAIQKSLTGERAAASPFWDFARRNHLPAVLAVGGVFVLGLLARRLLARRSIRAAAVPHQERAGNIGYGEPRSTAPPPSAT